MFWDNIQIKSQMSIHTKFKLLSCSNPELQTSLGISSHKITHYLCLTILHKCYFQFLGLWYVMVWYPQISRETRETVYDYSYYIEANQGGIFITAKGRYGKGGKCITRFF